MFYQSALIFWYYLSLVYATKHKKEGPTTMILWRNIGGLSEYIQVTTATATRMDAVRIADVLVGKRLAACVQVVGPIISIYWWKGKIEKAEEWLCLLKTDKELYADIETVIREAHPYDVPEILAVPVIEGSKAYLSWMSSELKKNR